MIKDQAQAHMVVYPEVDVFRIYRHSVVHPLLITAAQVRRQDRLCVLPQINSGDTMLILRLYKHVLWCALFYQRRSRARRESRTRYFFQLMQSSGDSSRGRLVRKGILPTARDSQETTNAALRSPPRTKEWMEIHEGTTTRIESVHQ